MIQVLYTQWDIWLHEWDSRKRYSIGGEVDGCWVGQMVNQVVNWPLACTCIANTQELQKYAILCNITGLSIVTANSLL